MHNDLNKKILYASSAYPEQLYGERAAAMTDQQAQRFNRLVMKGFARNGCDVRAVSYLSTADAAGLPESLLDDGIRYSFVAAKGRGPARRLSVMLGSYLAARRILRADRSAFVCCDVLNIAVSAGAVLAARLMRRRAVGFVTDVPGMMSERGPDMNAAVNRLLIGLCTDYVFLTEQMNGLLNKGGKPYAVMEGLVDMPESVCGARKAPSEKRVVMYAGSIHRIYGIAMLVEAFIAADVDGAELHIYGTGDYLNELLRLCAEHENVKYMGLVENRLIIEAEREAALLVNPRPSTGLYTQYSFPSKILEYMSSGTPVLMNLLPGMPREYAEYVYLFERETAESYSAAIRELLSLDSMTLLDKGARAQQFVRSRKNCEDQIRETMAALGRANPADENKAGRAPAVGE